MGTYARLHLGKTPYALVVEVDRDTVFEAMHRLRAILLTIVCLTAAAVLLASLALARAIVEPLRELSQIMARVASGGNAENIDLAAGKEIGELAAAAGGLMGRFRRLKTENADQSRMITGLARLQGSIAGEMDLGELCLTTLEFLADFLDLHQADFFVENHDGRLARISRFPGHPDDDNSRSYPPEKAPIRRAAMEKGIGLFHRRSPDAPASSVSAIAAANLMIVPLVLRQIVKGALELEKREHFSSFDLRFVQAAARLVGAAVNTALIRRGEKERLAQARKQVEQLKRREAALEASTSDLRAQRRAFQASEEALQLKQLELEAANAQMAQSTAALEAHMAILKKQQEDMRRQNAELEETHRQLEQKARQLEISSRYKSEFMANMSHELRTPLNSILLLSRLLLENKENTLTDRQAEFARTIHMAGEDLLNLINDILDLAKVEAGKMELVSAPMHIRSMAEAMRVNFAPLAEQRGTGSADHRPQACRTDHQEFPVQCL
jgi:tubulin-specific chaperone A